MSASQPAAAAAAPPIDKPAEEYRLIPLELIDEPPEPMRESMDEVLMGELAGSIADVGLQVPIRVKPTADRFQVIAGHRRLIACRLVNLSPVPCIVDAGGAVSDLAKMVHENYGREDVNPVEEARLYGRLLIDLCENDVDKLVELVKKPRARVESRLLLLAGDEKVLTALHAKQISIAVANELNKVEDPDRRLVFLDAAVRSGATARMVMDWRVQSAGLAPIGPPPEGEQGTDAQPQLISPSSSMVCLFCGDGDDVHLMELLYLHRQCKKFVMRLLNRDTQQSNGAPAIDGAQLDERARP